MPETGQETKSTGRSSYESNKKDPSRQTVHIRNSSVEHLGDVQSLNAAALSLRSPVIRPVQSFLNLDYGQIVLTAPVFPRGTFNCTLVETKPFQDGQENIFNKSTVCRTKVITTPKRTILPIDLETYTTDLATGGITVVLRVVTMYRASNPC